MSEQKEHATTVMFANEGPSTSARACGQLPGHTVGCGCQCCCAARSASEPCTCPPEMQMSDSDTDMRHSKAMKQGKTASGPLDAWHKFLSILAKEYNFTHAPEPLFVGPEVGGSGYRWQSQLPGHIPNCPCERCQLLQGNSHNQTIKNKRKIYKYDSSFYGKIAHIPNCDCPPCRVKRGLSRLPPPKLPKFKYKQKDAMDVEDVPVHVEEPAQPNYDTHPFNCTCMECCMALGNMKPAGHPSHCKCALCRKAAGLVKPPGHAYNCTCDQCCAAAGHLKPEGHKMDCKCIECLLAIEDVVAAEGPDVGGVPEHAPEYLPPAKGDNSCGVCLYIVAAVSVVLLISMYFYWVGTL